MVVRPRPRLGWGAPVVAVVLVLAAGTAIADAPTPGAIRAKSKGSRVTSPAPVAGASAPTPARVPAGALGLMAFLDPETGLLTGPIGSLVPPADQRAASANILLEPVRTPTGGWLLDLQGTGMESYVLQIDPLGRRRVFCVQDTRRVPEPVPTPAAPVGEER